MAALTQLLRHNSLAYGAKRRYWLRQLEGVEAFVFCANTGRCGSMTLAHLLAAAEDAVSVHEPAPYMAYYPETNPDCAARERYLGGLFSSDRRRYYRELFQVEKISSIGRLAAGHRYYIETSNMFAKTFADLAAGCFGARLRVIHLWRDAAGAAVSFYKKNMIPKSESKWCCRPDDPENVVPAADLLHGAHLGQPFARCVWYWYEVETRITRLRAEMERLGVAWSALRTDELNDRDALLRVCRELSIEVDPSRLDSLVGSRLNTEQRREPGAAEEPAPDLPPEDERAAIHEAVRTALEERYGEQFWARRP